MFLTIKKKIIVAIFLFFLSFIGALLLVSDLVKTDFLNYTEGEREDEVYILTSYIESQYERDSGFNKNASYDTAMLALSMGYEMYLYDKKGVLVAYTKDAINRALPLAKRRQATHIKQFEEYLKSGAKEPFGVYELFLKNEEIGSLHLRQFEKKRTLVFIERSKQFLLVGVIFAFISSILLGMFITSKILTPISKLHKAAYNIAKGKKVDFIEINREDEIGELANAFNFMAKSLNERERARKSSMSKFAHELRTPLAIMQGELEAMIDNVLPLETERLKSINEEVMRLKKMVEGLESLYKIEKGAANLNLKELDLCSLLNMLKERFIAKAREYNNAIHVYCENVKLKTDTDLLTQLLYNLLDNAMKATKDGSIMLSARNEIYDVIIEVTDTGKGIEKEDLPFIFDRFYTKSEDGLGIGLVVVKEITEILGGEITVASGLDRGTTFTIAFKNQSSL